MRISNKAETRTALALLDGMIGGLCRDDPAQVARTCIVKKSLLDPYGLRRKGRMEELLNACLLPTKDVSTVRIVLQPNGVHGLKLARASLEALYDQLGSKIWSCSLESQLSAYKLVSNWPMKDFVKNAKFWVVYPMARFLHNDPPADPPTSYRPGPLGLGPALLYSGGLKRLLKNRLMTFSKKNCSLFLTLLQGVKRGCEAVPASFIHESMLKHRAALARTSNMSWYMSDLLEPYFNKFFSRLTTVEPKLFEPSTSASYESVRSEGGARGFLQRELFGGSKEYPILAQEDLLEMYEYRPGDVREVRAHIVPSPSEVVESVKARASLSSLGITPDPIGVSDVLELLDLPLGKPLESKVRVSAVLEPLKVRLITKGESWKYWISKFYQKHLWGYLQKFPQFVATGRPIQTWDFYELISRTRRLGLDDYDLFVSGDYSAATDSLKLDYTKMAFEASLARSGLDPTVRNLLRSVLYEQEITYPPKEGIPDLHQMNGQLMGSTLSFPILCAVNFVAFWFTLETWVGHTIPMDQVPVLINGDDILFLMPSFDKIKSFSSLGSESFCFYDLWKLVISEVGFELSLGKNYVHDKFFTMNSEGFVWDHQHEVITPIPWFNVGLLLGQAKVTGRMSSQLLPIWDLYDDVISGAASKLRAHRRFLHYHKDEIKALTQSGEYNLFVDPLFGGLGMKLTDEVRPSVRLTAFQRSLGTYLKDKVSCPFEGLFEPMKAFCGLVIPSRSAGLQRKHFHLGKYRRQLRFQPLREGERVALDPTRVISAPMAVTGFNTDKPTVRVRPINRKVLKSFRASRLCSKPSNLCGLDSLLRTSDIWVEYDRPILH